MVTLSGCPAVTLMPRLERSTNVAVTDPALRLVGFGPSDPGATATEPSDTPGGPAVMSRIPTVRFALGGDPGMVPSDISTPVSCPVQPAVNV